MLVLPPAPLVKRAVLVLLPLVVGAVPRTGDVLLAVHREGRVVTVEHEKRSRTELADLTVRINGEAVTGEIVDAFAENMSSEEETERVVSTSWIDACDDGLPVAARRRFDEVRKITMKGDEETEGESPLEGRTLVLKASGEDVEAEPAEDDDGPALDAIFLKGHRLTAKSDLYLPDEPVDVGDTWVLDDAAARKVAGIDDHGPTLFEDAAEDDGEDFFRALEGAVRVSAQVEFVEKATLDGVECAVLSIELSFEAPQTEIDPGFLGMDEEANVEATMRMSFSMEVEDRLWFALEAGHAVRWESEMRGSVDIEMVMVSADLDGMRIEVDAAAELSGEFTTLTKVE